MALSGNQLAIETPCPVDLDRSLSDGRTRAWDCAHCSKTVHVLSAMTEREARSFLQKHEGQTLCITYLEGEDGEIRFQPERTVVPLGRLTRSVRRRPAAAAAAVGFAAALAACTPTDNDAVRTQQPAQVETVEAEVQPTSRTSMSDLVAEAREKAAEPQPEVKPEPTKDPEPETIPEPIVDPKAIPRPGGLRVPPIPPTPPTTTVVVAEEEPCDSTETATTPTITAKPTTVKRGGLAVKRP